VRAGGREILLVGTAHVSRESADLVRDVIREERPDHVCIELDEERYQALSQQARWENLDLREIMRKKQLATLVVNLLLGSYQKRIGDRLGVMPGTELVAAARAAEEAGIPFSLCDRRIRVTLLRAWRSMSVWQKAKLAAAVTAGVLGGAEVSEEQLRELRRKDVLSEVLRELAEALPVLKRVLIDERDTYLAEMIRRAEGRRVVAVVGAGHVEGIREALLASAPSALEPIDAVPPASRIPVVIGWSIPLVILGSLGYIAWSKGGQAAGDSLLFWILLTGIPSSAGAVLALAHPLTVLAAFVAAPITTLSPVIGAGYVTAFVQAWVRPPLVRDFQTLAEDAAALSHWWRNRLLKVLLAFILPTLGAAIGMYVGSYEILSNLF
jgi:pheromone shutdown-related protein TraB